MSKNKIIIVIVFAIISFFIFRHSADIGLSAVETASSSLLYPLLRIQRAMIIPMTQWFEHRATIHQLRTDMSLLQAQNEELYAENSALKAVHLYENETHELRNFNKRYELHNGCMAQVLARHFSATKQFFLVDAGAHQGIKKDMVAVHGNNILGRVAHVYPWYCEVCLITDADCKVASSFSKRTASGIHEGCNSTEKTIVRYVSHLEAVHVGDTVLSSGEGLVFPKGFALGKVVSAEKGELFYTITVKPIVNFQTLQYCTLIAKEDILIPCSTLLRTGTPAKKN